MTLEHISVSFLSSDMRWDGTEEETEEETEETKGGGGRELYMYKAFRDSFLELNSANLVTHSDLIINLG